MVPLGNLPRQQIPEDEVPDRLCNRRGRSDFLTQGIPVNDAGGDEVGRNDKILFNPPFCQNVGRRLHGVEPDKCDGPARRKMVEPSRLINVTYSGHFRGWPGDSGDEIRHSDGQESQHRQRSGQDGKPRSGDRVPEFVSEYQDGLIHCFDPLL